MRQIWIQTKTAHRVYLDTNDGQIHDVAFYQANDDQIGDILYGTVDQIDERLNVCFLDVGGGRRVYLPFQSLYNHTVRRGDYLLVQVERLATQSKLATVTTNIQFKTDALVYLPLESGVRISHKLSETERDRLSALWSASDIDGGIVVRTKASQQDGEVLRDQLNRLIKHYQSIDYNRLQKGRVLSLYDPFIEQLANEDPETIDRLIVDTEDMKEKIRQFVPSLAENVTLDRRFYHHKPYAYHQLAEYLTKRHIRLSNGASIVIDRAEALTAIDVDFGSYQSKQTSEPSYMVINREAVQATSRVLRERNLSGAIIVDLLNMKTSKEQKDVIKVMKQQTALDYQETHVVGFTTLGMLEVTRKRTGVSSYQLFGIDERSLDRKTDFILNELEEVMCWYQEDTSFECLQIDVRSDMVQTMKSYLKQLQANHQFHFHVFIHEKKSLQEAYQLYKIGNVAWLLSQVENEGLSIDKLF
ncbi:ribonuclease G [Alkalibacillus flavidus]|uniref:Ribonuclease G n=1 Tax=Alkalibacillus flavidus TaxID=546021 RepID=A0ABV2KT27_9BACI